MVGVAAPGGLVADQDVGLVGREIHVFGDTLLETLGPGQLRGRVAARQGLAELFGDRFRLLAADVTDQGDDGVAGGVIALMERHQIVALDAGQAFQRAGLRMAVRMIAEQGALERLVDLRPGHLLLHLQALQGTGADPLQGVLGKGGGADHPRQQVHGVVTPARPRQGAQADHAHVLIAAGGEAGAAILETTGDVVHAQPFGALAQQGAGERGHAGLVAVAGAAGVHHQAHVEHRQRRRGHEHDLGALLGTPGLNLQLRRRRRRLADLLGGGREAGAAGQQQRRHHPYRHWGGQAFYRLHHSSPSGITWATALRSATSHFRAAC